MSQEFERWTDGRQLRSIGTNAGSVELPFQNWRRFKEAFAPELIAQAVQQSSVRVRACLDPFGGSGTTALACQFLNIHPVTIEVNPFLADLIEAKLSRYSCDALARDFGAIVRRSRWNDAQADELFGDAPATFLEPGVNGRWIFDRDVAERIAKISRAIERVKTDSHRRLFKVLLGGILVDVSNVVVSGKGRRYRRGLRGSRNPQGVDLAFRASVRRAITEIHTYDRRPHRSYEVVRADCRSVSHRPRSYELAVFSPPYPNSFDYTDVYNVELWTLGYLKSSEMNQALRRSTLSSHVQISRDYLQPPVGSKKLDQTLRKLRNIQGTLWNRWIPDMVGSYFADMLGVLTSIRHALTTRGAVWVVVGDSRYGGVQIPTASIIGELASQASLRVQSISPFRSMRVSPQQGGLHELDESLLVLRKG